MYNSDNEYIRNFLLINDKIRNNIYYDYQDPTYLSFEIMFDIFEDMEFISNNEISESLLIKNPQSPYSALYYLRSINDYKREYYLKKFIELLENITFNTPWYFSEIVGINKLLTINPTSGVYPSHDAEITINCMESVDNKIYSLLHLYRNIVYDTKYNRIILPENMRWFNMIIIIEDQRDFHISKTLLNDYLTRFLNKNNIENRDIGSNDIKKLFNNLYDKNLNIKFYKDELSNMLKNSLISSAYNFIYDKILQYFEVNELIPFNSWKPRYIIECKQCEFKFDNINIPDNIATVSENPLTASINIKVRNIKEYYMNNIFDIYIDDTNTLPIFLDFYVEKDEKIIKKIITNKLKKIQNKILGNIFGNIKKETNQIVDNINERNNIIENNKVLNTINEKIIKA